MRKLLAAAGIAAVLGTGGFSAFTASNSMPGDIDLGYGHQTISGVTVESIAYNTDAATHSMIESVTLVVTGDSTTDVIKTAFTGSFVPEYTVCEGGIYDSEVTYKTTYTCPYNNRALGTVTGFSVTATGGPFPAQG